MRAHLLGVRGSVPTPGLPFVRYGGNTSCVALAHDGQVPGLVLDAGTGIQGLTTILGDDPFEGSLLLSHLHWDHVEGLPFCTAIDRHDARCDLHLPAQPDGTGAEATLARMMSPPNFPIGPDGLLGSWSFSSLAPGTHHMEGFTVTAAEIAHKGGTTYGYRVADGGSVLAYLPDHCPTNYGPGPDGSGRGPALRRGAGRRGRRTDPRCPAHRRATPRGRGLRPRGPGVRGGPRSTRRHFDGGALPPQPATHATTSSTPSPIGSGTAPTRRSWWRSRAG